MQHAIAQNKMAQAKKSLARLNEQIARLAGNKRVAVSNESIEGRLAQVRAWEDFNMGFNQYGPALGIHE